MAADRPTPAPPAADPMDRNGRLFAGSILRYGCGNPVRRDTWVPHFLFMTTEARWEYVNSLPAPLDDPDMDAFHLIRQVFSEVEAHKVIERAQKAVRPADRRPRKKRSATG